VAALGSVKRKGIWRINDSQSEGEKERVQKKRVNLMTGEGNRISTGDVKKELIRERFAMDAKRKYEKTGRLTQVAILIEARNVQRRSWPTTQPGSIKKPERRGPPKKNPPDISLLQTKPPGVEVKCGEPYHPEAASRQDREEKARELRV